MAGLNNLISNTAQQTTTLPTWFDTAQQNVVNQATAANTAAPTPQNTVAQQAVNQLSGPTNAFTNATGTLQGIASGAANPWITDAFGNVTPNTSTALGGLFQAQNQQLQQLAPNIMDPVTASGTGSGQFGSLRTQTAADKALTDAQAQLFAQQNQAALSNQSTGVQAGIGAGNVAQQGINNLLTTGQYQQAAPFTNVSNYGKVIGGITAPTTVSNQTQLSPLNQLGGLATLGNGVLGQLFGTPATGTAAATTGLIGSLSDYIKNFKNPFASSDTSSSTDSSGNSTVSLNNGNGSVSTNLPINDPYTSSSGGDTTAPIQ
jgi:hypothetical protein